MRNSKKGTKGDFSKMATFLGKLWKDKKIRNKRPYNSVISMDGKLNYFRFVLCKNPHEKRAIRREKAISVKESRIAIFRKTAKGGTREIFQKWPIF